MLGVIIHGAIRNITVSVKMGVNGMPWAWERRGAPESHIGRCGPLSVGELTMVHLLSTYCVLGAVASIISVGMSGFVFLCAYADVCASAHGGQKRVPGPLEVGLHANVSCPYAGVGE